MASISGGASNSPFIMKEMKTKPKNSQNPLLTQIPQRQEPPGQTNANIVLRMTDIPDARRTGFDPRISNIKSVRKNSPSAKKAVDTTTA